MGNVSLSLLESIQQCQECNTIKGHKKFPIDSHGQFDAKYLLVSEAPGKASLLEHKYWTGVGGKLLRSIFNDMGIELEDNFYLTDIVKCWPNENNKNRKPNSQEVGNCSQFLIQEIEELSPTLIIALGKTVSEILLDRPVVMRESHGKLFKAMGTNVLVLYHPSNINYSMNASEYKLQLKTILGELLQDIDNAMVSHKSSGTIPAEIINSTKTIGAGRVFYFPTQGNSITAGDIKKSQLRVTIALKRYFPSHHCHINAVIGNEHHTVRFIEKGKRSHILKFDRNSYKQLGVREGCRIKVTKLGSNEFILDKV